MPNIYFTRHADEILKERKLERALVENALLVPDWKEPAEESVWSAFKRVGKKVLRVVARQEQGRVTVITAYFDRRKR